VGGWTIPDSVAQIRDGAVAPNGEVFLLGSDERVYRYTSDGQLIASWPTRRFEPIKPNGAASLAVEQAGTVLVAESFQHRVVRYSPEGNELASWSFRNAPGPMAPASDGTFWVSAPAAFEPGVFHLSADGTVLTSWKAPVITHLTVDNQGALFGVVATEGRSGYVVKLSADGRILATWGTKPGSAPGQFGSGYSPGGLTIDRDGLVWIADPGNKRIQAFTGDGGVVKTCGQAPSPGFPGVVGEVAAAQSGRLYVSETRRAVVYGPDAVAPAEPCLDVPLQAAGLRASPKRFAPARRRTYRKGGTHFTVSLNRAATLRFSILRAVRLQTRCSGRSSLTAARCRHLVSVTTLTAHGHPGQNQVRFAGWTSRRKLRSGTYALRLTARESSGQTSKAGTSFTVR
jgi:sugar lactone lactonase YvrE